jgi:hypothetical protein
MSKSSQPQRTVRDIKTLAGKAEDLHTPHKMYMRLFALETERHRRMQERASAMLRIANIDARCAEIDAEKEILLDLLGVEAIPADLRPGGQAANCASRAVPRPDPRHARVRREAPVTAAEPVYEPVRIRY